MPAVAVRKAAGAADPGRQRDVNEDRVFVDAARGIYMVVDGIGGQAAGGRAADLAVQSIRQQLETTAGTPADRVRQAIAAANNEIYRAATSRAEWSGMACVLTVVVANGERATVGHVGDTRLYRVTVSGLEKVTHDHSPIGEREDAGELSEHDAMRHPRRNEVYRDVGSEPHTAGDTEFIDVHDLPLAADEAFLLCSDGLTDLVDSGTIHEVVMRQAGDPDKVARALIDAANSAGGKDNIAAVYSEGAAFGAAARAMRTDTTRRHAPAGGFARRAVSFAATLAAGVLLGAGLIVWVSPELIGRWQGTAAALVEPPLATATVRAGESINAALQRATPGSEVIVEPGDYREQVALVSGVRLVSQTPRGATLRLPGSTADTDAAIVATEVTGAEVNGFRIVGDMTAPLGTAVVVGRGSLALVDVEVVGATRVGVEVLPQGTLNLVGSRVHDNPGAAIALRTGSQARVAHSAFARNGTSSLAQAAIVIEPGAAGDFTGNTLQHVLPGAFAALGDTAAAIAHDNWFLSDAPRRPDGATASPRGSRSRR